MHDILESRQPLVGPAPTALSRGDPAPARSLNMPARRKEAMRITAANLAMLGRLRTVKPVFQTAALLRDGKTQAELAAQIGEFSSGRVRNVDRSRPASARAYQRDAEARAAQSVAYHSSGYTGGESSGSMSGNSVITEVTLSTASQHQTQSIRSAGSDLAQQSAVNASGGGGGGTAAGLLSARLASFVIRPLTAGELEANNASLTTGHIPPGLHSPDQQQLGSEPGQATPQVSAILARFRQLTATTPLPTPASNPSSSRASWGPLASDKPSGASPAELPQQQTTTTRPSFFPNSVGASFRTPRERLDALFEQYGLQGPTSVVSQTTKPQHGAEITSGLHDGGIGGSGHSSVTTSATSSPASAAVTRFEHVEAPSSAVGDCAAAAVELHVGASVAECVSALESATRSSSTATAAAGFRNPSIEIGSDSDVARCHPLESVTAEAIAWKSLPAQWLDGALTEPQPAAGAAASTSPPLAAVGTIHASHPPLPPLQQHQPSARSSRGNDDAGAPVGRPRSANGSRPGSAHGIRPSSASQSSYSSGGNTAAELQSSGADSSVPARPTSAHRSALLAGRPESAKGGKRQAVNSHAESVDLVQALFGPTSTAASVPGASSSSGESEAAASGQVRPDHVGGGRGNEQQSVAQSLSPTPVSAVPMQLCPLDELHDDSFIHDDDGEDGREEESEARDAEQNDD